VCALPKASRRQAKRLFLAVGPYQTTQDSRAVDLCRLDGLACAKKNVPVRVAMDSLRENDLVTKRYGTN